MKILGIETSCDETAIAVLNIETFKPLNIKVLSNVVSSQVKLHAKYGGVVPHLAAREHEKNLPRVLKLAIQKAGVKNIKSEISFIAVTVGPGLSPALWRGVNFAKELAEKYKKPIIGVNHLEGHIYSNWLRPVGEISNFKPKKSRGGPRKGPWPLGAIRPRVTFTGFLISKQKLFPTINLIVSGGHTLLVLMKGHGKYKVIGETLDDAVGEAFDKVARLLNLGYPGGPTVALRATQYKKLKIKNKKYKENIKIEFPRPMIKSKNYDFSFSGLKTSVLYKLKDLQKQKVKLTKNLINQICYEFQKAAIEVLVVKTIKAAKELKVKSILLSGGVSANKLLRRQLRKEVAKIGLYYAQPEMEYTTDNAAMITLAGYFSCKKKTGKVPAVVNANLSF